MRAENKMAITNISRANLEERIEEVDSLWDLLAVYNGSLSPERAVALILQGVSELSASGGGGGGTSAATIASGIDASIDINTIIAALNAIALAPPLDSAGTSAAIITAINASSDIDTVIARLTALNDKTPLINNGASENITNGTILTGGTSQLLLDALPGGTKRGAFELVNTSAETLWVLWGASEGAAGINQGFPVAAGGSYTNPVGHCPQGKIFVFGATTGSKFAAWQNTQVVA